MPATVTIYPPVSMLEATSVKLEEVLSMAKACKAAGQRLLAMTFLMPTEDTVDILYHFDTDLHMIHYRLSVSREERVPSISSVYFCAMLYENEACDQYGVQFDGLVLDYQGSLYFDADNPSPYVRGPSYSISTSEQKADDLID